MTIIVTANFLHQKFDEVNLKLMQVFLYKIGDPLLDYDPRFRFQTSVPNFIKIG